MSDSKKRAEVITSFKDEGTGERFEAGATPLIEAGAFDNYEAAGLVRAPTASAKSAVAPRTVSARPRRASRAKRAASTPPVGAKPGSAS